MGFENFPEELKKLPQWVVHKNKLPHNPKTGDYAKANDPTTWADFETAVKATEQFDGIGFEFNNCGVVGVDLDHVIDDSGNFVQGAEWAKDVVLSLNSYTAKE